MPQRQQRPYPVPGFGIRLKEARKRKGLTQMQLANLMPTGQNLISAWELEKVFPDDRHLLRLGDVLDIELPIIARNRHNRRTWRSLNCEVCGKQFPFSHKAKYCSRVCSRQAMSNRPAEARPNWKGGKYVDGSGYVLRLAPDNPMASKRGYVLEHRLVMSEMLGRPLEQHETVHHKNGIRNDNRPENLELWSGQHRPGVRVSDAVVDELLSQSELLELDAEARTAIRAALERILSR